MSDDDHLRRYVEHGSHEAFAAIVRRHLDLVYSVARRHVPSAQLAEDVAQSTFIELARKARTIKPGTPLVAWLHVVSRRIALNALRGEARRLAREQAAATLTLNDMKPASPSREWTAVEPLLDEAVESLPAPDRTAILLRFFENKSLREVGAALGASEDAAQKRVTRALEQLRTFLLRRGVAVTAAGLASDLSAHAIVGAPATLGPTVAWAAASATSGALGTGTILMSMLQKSTVVAALALAGGAAVYQTSVVARQTSELNALHARVERSDAALRELRSAVRADTAALKRVEAQIDARLAQAAPASAADLALETQMKQWLAQIDQLKQLLASRPELNIPELQLLNEQDWFDVASTRRLDSEEQLRRATAALRHSAESRAVARIFRALKAYVHAHDDMLPNDPRELAPHFDPPIDPAILDRYQMLRTGKASEAPASRTSRIMAPKTLADPDYDAAFYVGLNSYGNRGARQ